MTRPGFCLATLGVLLICGAPVCAKEPAAQQDLTDLITRVRDTYKVPAMGVAIVRARGVTALGVAGTRRWGGTKPVTKDDLWHFGSCTKAMTATLIARLVEKGTLRFEDTLKKRLPKFSPRMHKDYESVTLELLLSNRGGPPTDLSADGLWEVLWRRQGTPREQRMVLMQGVLPKAPAYAPGTKYIYSNAGFAIAGGVAEEVTDTPWEELMRRHVFQPLGMTRAGFGLPGTVAKEDQPLGHRPNGDGWLPIEPGPLVDNPPSIGPAGTVHGTLEDWGRFLALHLRGARGEESKYLTSDTFKRLHTPPKGNYAMGWAVYARPWASGNVLNHNGSNNMWYCVTWVAPARGFAVLATCNAAGGEVPKACDAAIGMAIQKALQGSK